jgi:hypothetical protein
MKVQLVLKLFDELKCSYFQTARCILHIRGHKMAKLFDLAAGETFKRDMALLRGC